MKSKILEILNHPNLALDLPDPDSLVASFTRFCQLWQKWNEKINLTSEKNWEAFFERHVFDSLQFARWMEPGNSLMDIGSGGGFPGIPLKIMYPESLMALVESQRKRAGFLSTAGAELGFSEFEVRNARIEDLVGEVEMAGRFDRVVFRAVTDTQQCLEWARPFVHGSGRVIIKKPLEEKDLLDDVQGLEFELKETLEIVDYHGKPSQLLAFQKAS